MLAPASIKTAARHSTAVRTDAFEHRLVTYPAGIGVALKISNHSLIEKNFGFRAAFDLIGRINRIMAIEYDCQPGSEFEPGHLSYLIPKIESVQIESRNLTREEAIAQAVMAIIVAASCANNSELLIPVVEVVAVIAGESAPLGGNAEVTVALARQKLRSDATLKIVDDNYATEATYRNHMSGAAHFLSTLLDGQGEEYATPICNSDDCAELYRSLFVAGIGADNQICSLDDGYRSVSHIGLARAVDEMRVSRALRFLSGAPLTQIGVPISADSAVLDHWWRNIIAESASDRALASRLYLEILPPSDMKCNSALLEFCREMRSLGIHIVLDQFGAGGSSLRDILALQPDYVKIEPSFLWRAQSNSDAFQTLRHLVGFAHSLKAPAIIMGVDSPQLSATALDVGGKWMSGRQFGFNRASYNIYDSA